MTSKERVEHHFENGKEALEFIRYLFYGDYPKGTPFGELEAIEKDLDRLEEYRKTNEELNKKIIELEDKIIKKGKELYKTAIEKDELEERNKKLEKVIEILKDLFEFELDKPTSTGEYPLVYRDISGNRHAKPITKERHELLKEVFGDER